MRCLVLAVSWWSASQCQVVSDINLTVEKIETAIRKIRPSSAPGGPDGIPAYLYNTYYKKLVQNSKNLLEYSPLLGLGLLMKHMIYSSHICLLVFTISTCVGFFEIFVWSDTLMLSTILHKLHIRFSGYSGNARSFSNWSIFENCHV